MSSPPPIGHPRSRPQRLAALLIVAGGVLLAHAGLALGLAAETSAPALRPAAMAQAIEVSRIALSATGAGRGADVAEQAGAASADAVAPTRPALSKRPMQAVAAPRPAAAGRAVVPAGTLRLAVASKASADAGGVLAVAAISSGDVGPDARDAREDAIDAPAAPPMMLNVSLDNAASADATASTTAAAASAPGRAAAAAESGSSAPPVYPTKPPTSTTLRYDLTKGVLSVSGQLRWKADGTNYDAVLESSVLGVHILDWHSSGGFDAAGLAPARFTDQRRGVAMRAANFQRDKRLISYSGPATQFPLHAGAQDRLSWMVQLAAIANARTSSWNVGDRVTMFVTGARADAALWVFAVQGRERLNLPTGVADTWRLLREPQDPRDTRVDVWLDPALQNLPVRARMAQSDGDAMELRLTGVGSPP